MQLYLNTEAFETTCYTVKLSIEGDRDSVTLRIKPFIRGSVEGQH